jgi:hypothetical protein
MKVFTGSVKGPVAAIMNTVMYLPVPQTAGKLLAQLTEYQILKK